MLTLLTPLPLVSKVDDFPCVRFVAELALLILGAAGRVGAEMSSRTNAGASDRRAGRSGLASDAELSVGSGVLLRSAGCRGSGT